MQVGIDMGVAQGGAEARLDLEELLATRLLVQGNSGSGKSHLLRRLLEQSAPWVQQCIIDPEGDFVTLADVTAISSSTPTRTEAELTGIAARVRQHRVSVVLNLEGLDVEQQMRAAAAFLGGLFDADRDYWYPDAGRGRRSPALRARRRRRSLRRGAQTLARRHDQPDVPRPQARPGRRDRHPAAGQAGQERRGRSLATS